LSLASKRQETRDVLCDLLWGGRSQEQARPHLRQTLWLIKTQISDRLLTVKGDVVSIADCLDVDVCDFLNAIERGDFATAVDLYAGDFFSGYAAPGAGQFEEWASLERGRLRGRFMSGAETLARRALDTGHFADAIRLTQQMRTADPNAQAPWRLLIEARLASGDMIGLHADADQFEEWLRREEWEAEPASLATIRLARRSAPPQGEDAVNDLTAELVGREREFSLVQDMWRSVESNKGNAVHIIGESGLGKTRLVRDIIARIRAGRGRARYLKANYGERAVPFSFVSSIANELSTLPGARGVAPAVARTLISLNPVLSSMYQETSMSSEPLEPLRVGLALLDMIAAISDDKPFAIAIDDLHWADHQSRSVLAVVASRVGSHQVLMITASRPGYTLAKSQENARHITLSRLTENDVGLLIASLAELPDEEWSRNLPAALHKSSDGNPLAILENLRYSIDTGIITRKDGRWRCTDSQALIRNLDDRTVTDRRVAELDACARRVLLTLCVAGIPLSVEMVCDSLGLSAGELRRVASDLELRGLIISDEAMLLPAHDAIAEALLSNATQSEMREAHTIVGNVMGHDKDEASRKRAVSHFVAAGNLAAATELIIPIVRRIARSSRDVHDAVSALVGDSPSGHFVAIVEKELPLFVRFPRLKIQIGVAAIVLAAVISLIAYRSQPTAIEDIGTELVLFAESPDGGTDIGTVRLNKSRWNPGVRLATTSSRHLKTWIGDDLYHAPARPGSHQWAVYHIYPDSGEGDIDLVDIDGKRTRLVSSRGDDRPGMFSPDGRYFLFLSTRWNDNGWSDIAMLDLVTGMVKRVSEPGWNYDGATWSPDGTRIAYGRHDYSGDVQELCIADANGTRASCGSVAGRKHTGNIGWVDERRMLLTATGGNRTPISIVYDVDAGNVTSVDAPSGSEIHLDPTGSWALTNVQGDSVRLARISPSTQYAAASEVPETDRALKAIAFASPDLGEYVDRIRISRPIVALAPQVPYRLHISSVSRAGRQIVPGVIRWRSLTPLIASVDSLGVVVPLKPGSAIIEASAGGWRTTVDTIRVEPSHAIRIVDERWEGNVLARWKFFGKPKPSLIREGDNIRFLNNGDGNFFSGAYLNWNLDAREGLAMDLEISTPISRYQWQIISVLLQPVSSRKQLDEWDHVTGYISERFDRLSGCDFTYPAGEGRGALSPPWFESWRRAVPDSSNTLIGGEWYIIRVQLFPDGRCGLAINSHPVRIGAGTHSVRLPFLAMTYGNSVGTRILVGRIVLTSGVPDDINWSRLQFDGSAWINAR
jgi:DNA-binding SARP family transcriptional activator